MILDVSQLLLLGLLCASTHWIVARSEIARPFWSRVTGRSAKLLVCPACSGWWLGALSGALNFAVPVPFPSDTTFSGLFGRITQVLITAALGVVVTPVFEGLLLWGLRESAVVEEPEPPNQDAIITPVHRPRGP